MYTAEELHHQLKDSNSKIVLTAAPFKDIVEKAVQGTNVQRIIFAGAEDDFSFAPGVEFAGTPASIAADTAKATVVMPYSSGTTGAPKGTMLSHRNLTNNVAQISEHPEFNLAMNEHDRVIGKPPRLHYSICMPPPHHTPEFVPVHSCASISAHLRHGGGDDGSSSYRRHHRHGAQV